MVSSDGVAVERMSGSRRGLSRRPATRGDEAEEAVPDRDAITIVVGRFEPLVGVEEAVLARVLARHVPQVALLGGSRECELLVRLKVSQTGTGVVVAHDRGQLRGKMLLVTRVSSPTRSAPHVDVLTGVRAAASGESGYSAVDGNGAAPEPLGASLLTDREVEVFGCLTEGRTNREIANVLHVSVDTVATHVRRIFRKLGVHSRQELIGMRVPQRQK
jgi:DNA-binding NarL/FixJ family response regulator